jgi:hypothetical protein
MVPFIKKRKDVSIRHVIALNMGWLNVRIRAFNP